MARTRASLFSVRLFFELTDKSRTRQCYSTCEPLGVFMLRAGSPIQGKKRPFYRLFRGSRIQTLLRCSSSLKVCFSRVRACCMLVFNGESVQFRRKYQYKIFCYCSSVTHIISFPPPLKHRNHHELQDIDSILTRGLSRGRTRGSRHPTLAALFL